MMIWPKLLHWHTIVAQHRGVRFLFVASSAFSTAAAVGLSYLQNLAGLYILYLLAGLGIGAGISMGSAAAAGRGRGGAHRSSAGRGGG